LIDKNQKYFEFADFRKNLTFKFFLLFLFILNFYNITLRKGGLHAYIEFL